MSRRMCCAMMQLRWVLGLVILAASARFAFSQAAAAAFAKTGLPDVVHVGLAWTEMLAAALFLIPRLTMIGGRLLIAIMAVAILIHVLHGWYDVGELLLYASAAWAVMAAYQEEACARRGGE